MVPVVLGPIDAIYFLTNLFYGHGSKRSVNFDLDVMLRTKSLYWCKDCLPWRSAARIPPIHIDGEEIVAQWKNIGKDSHTNLSIIRFQVESKKRKPRRAICGIR
ncbi:hypothetical protein AcW1_002079 [Taiwanofungus camphoratus]|nr:hypothetical protein AcW1_002079 [Antrodia cinnamomea]